MSLPAPEAPPRRPARTSRRALLGLLGGGALALTGGALLLHRLGRPPVVAVVAAAESEVHVDGTLVGYGTKVRAGSRVQAVKGDGLILLDGGRSAVLREGASLLLGGDGGQVSLERGRVRFEIRTKEALPNPFRVDAGMAGVEVLGTIFVVERRPTDERVLVAVQEGRVRVRGAKAERSLGAGEEATVVKGRLGPARPVAQGSLREDRQPALLERLWKRAGRLIDDWGP